jgi:hypothetical protein
MVARFERMGPGGLEELAPAYRKTVSIDPSDGKPLRYQVSGASYVVYSIGSDARDDGGVEWRPKHLKVPQDVTFMVKH